MSKHITMGPLLLGALFSLPGLAQTEKTAFLYDEQGDFHTFVCQGVDSLNIESHKGNFEQILQAGSQVLRLPVDKVGEISFVNAAPYTIALPQLKMYTGAEALLTASNYLLNVKATEQGYCGYLQQAEEQAPGMLLLLDRDFRITQVHTTEGHLQLNYGNNGKEIQLSSINAEGEITHFETLPLAVTEAKSSNKVNACLSRTVKALEQLQATLANHPSLSTLLSEPWQTAIASINEDVSEGKSGIWFGREPQMGFQHMMATSYGQLMAASHAARHKVITTIFNTTQLSINRIRKVGPRVYEASVKITDFRPQLHSLSGKVCLMAGILVGEGNQKLIFSANATKSELKPVEADGELTMRYVVPETAEKYDAVPIIACCDPETLQPYEGLVKYGRQMSLTAENEYAAGQTYYVDALAGKDTQTGTTPQQAYQSLAALAKIQLKAGDQILLKKGATYKGTIQLHDVQGTASSPVVLSSYGESSLPATIDAQGYAAGIEMNNCAHFEISDLAITADGAGGKDDTACQNAKMRCGLVCYATKKDSTHHIHVSYLDIHDIFALEEGETRAPGEIHTPNGTAMYGWGIRFINRDTIEHGIHDIQVDHCHVRDVSHTGIKLTGKNHSLSNISLHHNNVLNTGGPGIQMGGVKNAHIHHNQIERSGSQKDSRNWQRGSGFWCFASDSVLFEHNRVTHANGPQDSAGAHIDYNCSNVIYQYNFSAENQGAFCEILGNDRNCCYRYNVSVNDGQRKRKKGTKHGNTLFISGYVGSKPKTGPFNTYIYNNTIYVGKNMQSGIDIDRSSDGLLIANNIFYVMGNSINNCNGTSKNTLMKHNLFLNAEGWNTAIPVKNQDPLFGDPDFTYLGAAAIEAYIPTNAAVVKDKGIQIEALPNDSIGLYLGLPVEKDILGNPIQGLPDFGAIEMQ